MKTVWSGATVTTVVQASLSIRTIATLRVKPVGMTSEIRAVLFCTSGKVIIPCYIF